MKLSTRHLSIIASAAVAFSSAIAADDASDTAHPAAPKAVAPPSAERPPAASSKGGSIAKSAGKAEAAKPGIETAVDAPTRGTGGKSPTIIKHTGDTPPANNGAETK